MVNDPANLRTAAPPAPERCASAASVSASPASAAPTSAQSTTMPSGLRLCVAVPTFRRPEQLETLLQGIARQTLPEAIALEVVVFDNDVRPSAQAVVDAARAWFPFSLDYVRVAQPGLATVRNAIVDYARGHFDFVAMIDDDESPQLHWLSELVRVQGLTGADAVIGPVPQLIPDDAPRWLRAGSFFDLPVHPDAASIDFGYSGNCLLAVRSLERFGVTFDTALDFAGGEDLVFFRQLLARGAKINFAARAVAYERVGKERLNAGYLLRLNFRRGNTLALCDRRGNALALGDRLGNTLAPGAQQGSMLAPERRGAKFRALALRAGKATARLGLGALALIPLAIGRGRTGAMLALCAVAHGLGGLCGITGYTYQAYRRDDPS